MLCMGGGLVFTQVIPDYRRLEFNRRRCPFPPFLPAPQPVLCVFLNWCLGLGMDPKCFSGFF